jgi:hypothetical protein
VIIAQNAINEICIISEKAQNECEKLIGELSHNDRETEDILHFLEFEEFTLEIGYSAALKLKALRLARRKIKDELEPLQVLTTMLESQKLEKIQQRVDAKVSKQENRQYTPRVIHGGLAEAINI